MSTIELKASNIKCGGCASAIQEGLGNLPGVDRAITAKLAELGYPVAA